MKTANLDKAIAFFEEQIKFIHASGSNNVVLEEVKCDVYNSKMKIKELGTVNSLGGGTYVVNLWDSTIAEDVKNAILNTLSLNPIVEGNSLKVTFPAPTQEKRQELSKIVAKYAEECLIAIRNIRREEITEVEKQFKEKLMSEDQKNSEVNKIEKIIKEFSAKVEEIKNKKVAEINTL